MTHDELEKLEDIMYFCTSHDKFRRAPVGQAVEMLPESIKEFLRTLKSEDLNKFRTDYIQKYWL